MIIKNSYFAAIKTAMSEGKTDKWAIYHTVHGICSYSRYYEPHLKDYNTMMGKTKVAQFKQNLRLLLTEE